MDGTEEHPVVGDHDEPPPPLMSRERFDETMDQIIAEYAPRLFAVVQEYGDRADGRVAAWGMAFEDHAEAVTTDGSGSLRLSCAQSAADILGRAPHVTARIAWVTDKPSSATCPP